MTRTGWNGISSSGIDKLMTDIIDYAEKSNKIHRQIDEIVDGTKSYFKCDGGEIFRNKYSQMRLGSQTINKNILSYNTDMIYVKSNYRKRELGGVDIIKNGKISSDKED